MCKAHSGNTLLLLHSIPPTLGTPFWRRWTRSPWWSCRAWRGAGRPPRSHSSSWRTTSSTGWELAVISSWLSLAASALFPSLRGLLPSEGNAWAVYQVCVCVCMCVCVCVTVVCVCVWLVYVCGVCMCVCDTVVCVCVCVCDSPPLSPLGPPGVHGPSAAGKDPLPHHGHPPHEAQEEPQPQRYIYV